MKTIFTRGHFVKLHRWFGLCLAPFILLIALTGAIMAFYHELDEALNPNLFQVSPQGSRLPETQLLHLARQYSDAFDGSVNHLPLDSESDSVMFRVKGNSNFDQLFMNPYTGDVLGHRRWGDFTQSYRNIMGFIYQLHYKLAVPGKIGVWLMGVVALLWTVDCLVAFAISSPQPSKRRQKKSAWQRWRRVLSVRKSRKGLAFTFDLHRAAGLWVWAMLLIFAWSGVAFNLPAIYNPIMQPLLNYQPYNVGYKQRQAFTVDDQAYGFDTALQLARKQRSTIEQQYNIIISREDSLSYLPQQAIYRYRVHSDRDFNDALARTQVFFDAYNGEVLKVDLPSGQRAGNTFTRWLYALHMGQVFGVGYKILIASVGLLTCYLTYSGVKLWLRRRPKMGN